MKKILLISLGVMILSMAMVGAASANNGPHGNYSATTDKCAGCHRAHTAKGLYLLVGANEYDFCLTCHGNGSTGAGTNVQGGMWDNAGNTVSGSEGQRLNGGGFETIMGGTVTSKHNVAGDGEFATAWGGSLTTPAAANEQGTNLKGVLECTSCHNPHGSASYRILNQGTGKWQTTAANSFGTVPMNPYDVGSNGGTVDSSSRGYTWNADKMALGSIRQGFDARVNNPANLVVANYGNDISTFCGACHTEYVGGSSNWRKDWTDGAGLANGPDGAQAAAYAHRSRQDTWTYSTSSGTWREASNVVTAGGYPSPLVFAQSTGVNNNSTKGYYLQTCLTCHFAHGTSAQMSNWAAGVNNPNSVGFVDGSSANLFYDNRGVCITCHNP